MKELRAGGRTATPGRFVDGMPVAVAGDGNAYHLALEQADVRHRSQHHRGTGRTSLSSHRIIKILAPRKEFPMNSILSKRSLIVAAGVALSVGVGVGAAMAASDATSEWMTSDGGIGDTPIPVEPDGGIGDTSDDRYPVDEARNEAYGLLGRYEADLPDTVRIGRRGSENVALTEDYQLGRFTVELDDEGDGYRVTSATVELPGGPETFHLTPG